MGIFNPDATGEVQTRVMKGITSQIEADALVDVFENPITHDCCYDLPLFGELGVTAATADPLKNDKNSFLRHYDSGTLGSVMVLTKPEDPAFVDVVLDDDTYGIHHIFGFHVDGLGRNYVGYEFDWRLVLDAFGNGIYQVMTIEINLLGNFVNDFGLRFCLSNFTAEKENTTIRLHWVNSHMIRNRFDISDRIHYPDNWVDSLRVEGFFGKPKSELTQEVVTYQDASEPDISNISTRKYFMRVREVPAVVHQYIEDQFIQADLLAVTDYNANNPTRHILTPIRNFESYEPDYQEFGTLLSTTETGCESYFSTGIKKYCS